jgi:hypothetical protein
MANLAFYVLFTANELRCPPKNLARWPHDGAGSTLIL